MQTICQMNAHPFIATQWNTMHYAIQRNAMQLSNAVQFYAMQLSNSAQCYCLSALHWLAALHCLTALYCLAVLNCIAQHPYWVIFGLKHFLFSLWDQSVLWSCYWLNIWNVSNRLKLAQVVWTKLKGNCSFRRITLILEIFKFVFTELPWSESSHNEGTWQL